MERGFLWFGSGLGRAGFSMPVTLAPFETILAHIVHDTVTNPENKSASVVGPSAVELACIGKLLGGVEGFVRGFECALEVGNRHADFGIFGATKCGGQLCAAYGGSCGEADGFRVLAKICAFIEKVVHPAVESEGVFVNGRLGEFLKLTFVILFFLLTIAIFYYHPLPKMTLIIITIVFVMINILY